VRLAVREVPLGDIYNEDESEVVRVPRQAVWKLVVPGGTCPPPGDFAVAA